MYEISGKEKVIELDGVPQSEVGAPRPIVLSDDYKLLLTYCVQGLYHPAKGCIALVEFKMKRIFSFGSPNDEAISGHGLYALGLMPYGAYEVKESSWITSLEKMNSVHPMHRPERFEKLRHFIFAFHDSTFECVAEGFDVFRVSGSTKDVLAILQEKLLERR
jgi:hypothetical protein